MSRSVICPFNPSPFLSSAASNLARGISVLPLFLPLNFSMNRVRARRPLSAVVARYGGGYGPGPSRRTSRVIRVAADADYDPALDLDRIKSSSLGVVPIDEAIRMADDAELILAILSADADPPVLRLFDSSDYKKHKYEQQKGCSKRDLLSAASRVDIKELKMGYNIDSHDYNVRLRSALMFLKGDKVNIIVNLKGRENEFRNIAPELSNVFRVM